MLSYIDRSNGALKLEGNPELIITDVPSNTVMYIGKASIGSATSASVWRIMKLVTDANGGITLTYAQGSPAYTNVWDNRASLSYS